MKEGANKDSRHDHALDEELHVLVTGNTQEDVSGVQTQESQLRAQGPCSSTQHIQYNTQTYSSVQRGLQFALSLSLAWHVCRSIVLWP